MICEDDSLEQNQNLCNAQSHPRAAVLAQQYQMAQRPR